jgi:hypothetical protein
MKRQQESKKKARRWSEKSKHTCTSNCCCCCSSCWPYASTQSSRPKHLYMLRTPHRQVALTHIHSRHSQLRERGRRQQCRCRRRDGSDSRCGRCMRAEHGDGCMTGLHCATGRSGNLQKRRLSSYSENGRGCDGEGGAGGSEGDLAGWCGTRGDDERLPVALGRARC